MKQSGMTGKIVLIGLGAMLLYAELGPIGIIVLGVVLMLLN